jgi:hypothetical protein
VELKLDAYRASPGKRPDVKLNRESQFCHSAQGDVCRARHSKANREVVHDRLCCGISYNWR